MHINKSTVNGLVDGIGYVDSEINITNGALTGSYVNTTEYQYMNPPPYRLGYISVYGNSRITIKTTEMPSTTLFVYDFSQVTLINSNFSEVIAYNSSRITLESKSNAT